MNRLLAQLDRMDAGRHHRIRQRGDLRRKLTATALAVGLAFVIGLIFAERQFGVAVSMDGFHRRVPLGSPPEVVKGVGSFKFSMTQPSMPGRPVAYDPCRPIEYEVNDALAPAGTEGIVVAAVSEIEHATGLEFEYVGSSDRAPSTDDGLARPRREPVIIGWTTVDVAPGLAGPVAGLGGSSARVDRYTGDLEYVTGLVALDAPQLTTIMARPDGKGQVRAIVTHELGHLVGLQHVADRHELMFSKNVGQLSLGPGDREGLAALGSGRCY